jgi:hypothetical protein
MIASYLIEQSHIGVIQNLLIKPIGLENAEFVEKKTFYDVNHKTLRKNAVLS